MMIYVTVVIVLDLGNDLFKAIRAEANKAIEIIINVTKTYQ